ncbi:MAG: hypothetical protein WC587_00570 [Candidatus Paceibacterota bacterium]
MNKAVFIFIAIIITAAIGAGGYYFLFLKCPASCDDNNSCTAESCSKETSYKCQIKPIPDCCGNKSCERPENYENCPLDCPSCDDSNKCTKDSFDYYKQNCSNAPDLGTICCGNTACETGETYGNCARDCQNCNDDNKCTKDSYDYHRQQCLNEIIIPCCGNKICDKGVETNLSCSVECPNCNDGNKLTSDSFNYETQKCKNIVTHYFINDFEAGTQGWIFYNAVDGGLNPDAWTLVKEGNNTALKGVNHNFADLAQSNWDDYILKLKFKKISGSLQINFRNNFFMPTEITRRYILRLEEGGNHISLAKGLNENKGIYQELADSPASFEGGWHTLEIKAYNNIFNIYLDANLLIKYKDAQSPFLSGKINFETSDDTAFLFDDIEVKVISEKDIISP